MKPVAIFRHSPTEGPGYFATFLEEHGIPWQLIRIDAGEPIPHDPTAFSGLGFMGGPMSVNDPLPWIPSSLALIRAAITHDIPVIGHCLGGQLMSKALGGRITVNPVKEIGWHTLQVENTPSAHDWLGNTAELPVFQWHGDTFTIPPDAIRLAGSPHCQNQIYIIGTKHLGMQCHIEMTHDLVTSWCAGGEQEILESGGPAVQSISTILRQLDRRVPELNQVAIRIYQRWIKGLHSA